MGGGGGGGEVGYGQILYIGVNMLLHGLSK